MTLFTSRRLALSVALGIVSGIAASSYGGTEKASATAHDIAEKILARRSDREQVGRDFERLLDFAPTDRDAALITIMRRGDADMALSAVTILLRVDAAHAASSIAEHMRGLSAERQDQILGRQSRLGRTQGLWLLVPREVLSALPHQAPSDPSLPLPAGVSADPVGRAALLLATSDVRKDHDLVRKSVVLTAPGTFRSWAACARLGMIDDQIRALATSAYSNARVDLLARVAAAITVARIDRDAWQFANRQISEFVRTYSAQSAESLLSNMFTGSNPDRDPELFLRYSSHLRMLGLLQFVSDDRAREVLVPIMNAPNSEIALTAALTLLRRNPSRFWKLPHDGLSDKMLAELAAATTLLEGSQNIVPQRARELQGFDEEVERIKSVGLGSAFGRAGDVVFGL